MFHRFHAALSLVVPWLLVAALLGGCSGGSGDHGPRPSAHSIGGAVSGLRQGDSVLLKNGSESVRVSVNGRFAFEGRLPEGASYDVAVESPPGYACSVLNHGGVIAAMDISDIDVQCTPFLLAGRPALIQAVGATTVDDAGNIWVLDIHNQVVLKIATDGSVTTVAGSPGLVGYRDGVGAQARFHFAAAAGIVSDGQGNFAIVDGCNDAIRKLTPDGRVSTLAGAPTDQCAHYGSTGMVARDGQGTDARFGYISGIASDRAGGFYVADYALGIGLRHISAAGQVTSTKWSFSDNSSASFILSVAVDHRGTVYAADDWGWIWKCSDLAQPEYFAGRSYSGDREHEPADGQADAAEFMLPDAMAVDGNDNLFVGDLSRIRKVTPAGLVSTIAGTNANRGAADGQGRNAQFRWITSMASDNRGNLVVAESGASTLRQVSPAGLVSTMELTKAGGYRDGAWSEARFNALWAPALGADGNLYLTDEVQHVVRKIAPDGMVSLYAGTPGLGGSADGVLGAARFDRPGAIATGPDGSLYLIDGPWLRRIVNGTVSTIANVQGENYASGLAIDLDGNVAVSNPFDGVYIVTPSGTVSRVIDKQAVQPLLGEPGAAPFFVPQGLAFDRDGNLYVSDSGSTAIYKLDKGGKLTVFAGTPLVEGDQDGPPGTATFGYYGFDSLTIDGAGNLYLGGQGRMRKISPAGVVTTPDMAWGNPYLYGLAWGKGKLYGMTAYAILQLPVQ